ncbi:hypothetical protein DK871_08440 [Pseudomonas sp. L13]|nr:hypothetical protein [Pseudomonas sp. L13]
MLARVANDHAPILDGRVFFECFASKLAPIAFLAAGRDISCRSSFSAICCKDLQSRRFYR